MSYKTDKPYEVEEQIKEDGVSERLRNATDVLCLVCTRGGYIRVYLTAPKQKIVSVTIDNPESSKRMMEMMQITNKFRVQGAKVETG
jgi:hypothetical protein